MMNSYRLFFETSCDQKKIIEALQREWQEGRSGYYDLPQQAASLIERLESETLPPYNQIALFGIGGSSLGTKAIDTFLRCKHSAKEILYFENPTPLGIKSNFKKLKSSEALFVLISKSGTTIETIAQFKAALAHCNLTLQDNPRIIVISDENSPLHDFAKTFNLRFYPIPANVGGRFSVLSSVGIVPLYLAGFGVEEIVEGAARFLQKFFDGNAPHLVQKACFYVKNHTSIPMNVLLSYADILMHFNEWYVQLWGESLGKKDSRGNRIGLTPIAHRGPVDQHSFLQLLMEGPIDKSVTFIKIENFEEDLVIPNISLPHLEKTDFINGVSFNRLINEECMATLEAVQSVGVPVDLITLEKITPQSIGELIIYYELLTSATAHLLGIDAYNQPGVELGKKILKKRLL